MLAIIPARGGSKGVPKKNVKMVAGKPLIAHTIEAALKAKSINRVIVSTDDEEIASVAKSFGAEIPFMRPSELAQDQSMAIDNYLYTIERLSRESQQTIHEFAVLLPTSPLRDERDIDAAAKIFYEEKADSVISCTAMDHPLDWVFFLDEGGVIHRPQNKDVQKSMNRQASRQGYVPNGAVFILTYPLIKEKYAYYDKNTKAYVMPKERSIDIDNLLDFYLVECLWKYRGDYA